MTTDKKLIDVLNELILFNTDRITGYEKAIENTENLDVDLRAIFTKMADLSSGYKSELEIEVNQLGGDTAEGRTTTGKIYQAWMDLKATFTGNDRQSTLESCEYGEDAIQKAYKQAISTDVEMPAAIRQLLISQQEELKSSHDTIKILRDAHKAVDA